MILIISKENDISTTQVIEWLCVMNKEWIRINDTESVKVSFCGNEIMLEHNKKEFLLSSIKSCWYRRGQLNFYFGKLSNINSFRQFQKIELYNIEQYIYYYLSQIRTINSFLKSDVNKLVVSSIARKNNLKTPVDLLFSNKSCLMINTIGDKYITKSISGDSIQNIDDVYIINYTSILDTDRITSETFFPSLVQNKIEKKYELRIFFIADEFFTMAIFSQKDNQTQVDFRNYNNNKNNRTVPFELPPVVKEKLKLLMNNLGLNCGSIDMIVTPENDFVFLEVNPVGQFGMTSHPCNFNLEKKIAEYL